jgi:hypothetical protein
MRQGAARVHIRRQVFLVLIFAGLLAACASHLAPLRADQTVTIPGRYTAGLAGPDVARTMLLAAARATVDHGMAYFRIVSAPAAAPGYDSSNAFRPGSNVTIRLYEAGTVRLDMPDVWDAQKILTAGVSEHAVAVVLNAPPTGAQQPRSRCTAYGCP